MRVHICVHGFHFDRLSCEDGWMNDLRFYVVFSSVSVISGRWDVDNERLSGMETILRSGQNRLFKNKNANMIFKNILKTDSIFFFNHCYTLRKYV